MAQSRASTDARWGRLRRGLDAVDRDALVAPEGGRVGAALALIGEANGEFELVFTRRRDDLAHHPGQVSFAGGRVEPGESIRQAALREAEEEIGLDADGVEVLGELPAFYIPPSRYWLQTVVGRWRTPHPLEPAEDEVAAVLRVPWSTLTDPAAWRVVRLSTADYTWAWQLDEQHLLWGATGIITAVVLGLAQPDWNAGTDIAELAPEREVRPWEGGAREVPVLGRPRLPSVPEAILDADVRRPRRTAPPTPAQVTAFGTAVADAVRRLDEHADVLVLAGPGYTGAVGRLAADALGARATVCSVGAAARVTAGDAGVVVDAVLGDGVAGPLRGAALEALQALRLTTAPVVSVDLPSGLHPEEGLIGEAVSADVTVAATPPPSGLFKAGLAPFVGDLYLADADSRLTRVVPAGRSASWRE